MQLTLFRDYHKVIKNGFSRCKLAVQILRHHKNKFPRMRRFLTVYCQKIFNCLLQNVFMDIRPRSNITSTISDDEIFHQTPSRRNVDLLTEISAAYRLRIVAQYFAQLCDVSNVRLWSSNRLNETVPIILFPHRTTAALHNNLLAISILLQSLH